MFSPFYLSAFVWNLAHGMTNVLVPLYALHLGMSGVAIGSLVALPVILQLVFNLLGGIYVDRLGPKNVLYISCLASLGASAIYTLSSSYAGLFVGQCLFVLARASFWPASYSLGSQLPGDRGVNMGRLNSTTNAGQIAGTGIAGMVIAIAGYRDGFLASAGTALAAMALTAFIAYIGKRRSGPYPGIVATYKDLARLRSMYFAMGCAFLSVLPFTVSASFHPVLLVSQQYDSQQIGWLLTLRAIGAIFAGIALAHLVRSASNRAVPFWSCFIMGLALAASAYFPGAWAMGICLFILGLVSGFISVYFQLLISATSSAEQRGSAMAYGGVGWNLSNISAPLLMGVLTDWLDIYYAFYILGGLLLLYSFSFFPLYRWAFPASQAADSR